MKSATAPVIALLIALIAIATAIHAATAIASTMPEMPILRPSLYSHAEIVATRPAKVEPVSCGRWWRVSGNSVTYSVPILPSGGGRECVIEVVGSRVSARYSIESGQLIVYAGHRRIVLTGSGTIEIEIGRGGELKLVAESPLYTVARGRIEFFETSVSQVVEPVSGYAQLLPNGSMMYVFTYNATAPRAMICFRYATWLNWSCRGGELTRVVRIVVPNPIKISLPSVVAANYPVTMRVEGRCISGAVYLDGRPIANGTFPTRIPLRLSPGRHVVRAVCLDPPAIAVATVVARPIEVSWSVDNGWKSFTLAVRTSIRSGYLVIPSLGIRARIVNGSASITVPYTRIPQTETTLVARLVSSVTGAVVEITVPIERPSLVVTPTPSGYLVALAWQGTPVPATIVLKGGARIELRPQALLATLPSQPIEEVVADVHTAIVVPPKVAGATLAQLATSSTSPVYSVSADVVQFLPFETIVKIVLSAPPTVSGRAYLVVGNETAGSAPIVSGQAVIVASVRSGHGGFVLARLFLNHSLVTYIAVPVEALTAHYILEGTKVVIVAALVGPAGYRPYTGTIPVEVCGERVYAKFVDGRAVVSMPRPECPLRMTVNGVPVLRAMVVISVASYFVSRGTLMVLAMVLGGAAFVAILETQVKKRMETRPLPAIRRAERTVCVWSNLFARWRHFLEVNWGSIALPINEIELAKIADSVGCLPPTPPGFEEALKGKKSQAKTFIDEKSIEFWLTHRNRFDRFLEMLKRHGRVVKEHRVVSADFMGLKVFVPRRWLAGEGSIEHNAVVKLVSSILVAAGYDVYAPMTRQSESVPDLVATMRRMVTLVIEVVQNPSKLSAHGVARLVDRITRFCGVGRAARCIIVTPDPIAMYRALARFREACSSSSLPEDYEAACRAFENLLSSGALTEVEIEGRKYIAAPGHSNKVSVAAENVARARNRYQAQPPIYVTNVPGLAEIVDRLSRDVVRSVAVKRI